MRTGVITAFIFVVALAGLLAEAAELAQAVGDRRVARAVDRAVDDLGLRR